MISDETLRILSESGEFSGVTVTRGRVYEIARELLSRRAEDGHIREVMTYAAQRPLRFLDRTNEWWCDGCCQTAITEQRLSHLAGCPKVRAQSYLDVHKPKGE